MKTLKNKGLLEIKESRLWRMANVQTARVYYFADKLIDLHKFIERLAYAREICVATQLEARALQLFKGFPSDW